MEILTAGPLKSLSLASATNTMTHGITSGGSRLHGCRLDRGNYRVQFDIVPLSMRLIHQRKKALAGVVDLAIPSSAWQLHCRVATGNIAKVQEQDNTGQF